MTALHVAALAWALAFGYWAARILTWAAQDAIRARRPRRRQRDEVRRVRALGDALGGDFAKWADELAGVEQERRAKGARR